MSTAGVCLAAAVAGGARLQSWTDAQLVAQPIVWGLEQASADDVASSYGLLQQLFRADQGLWQAGSLQPVAVWPVPSSRQRRPRKQQLQPTADAVQQQQHQQHQPLEPRQQHSSTHVPAVDLEQAQHQQQPQQHQQPQEQEQEQPPVCVDNADDVNDSSTLKELLVPLLVVREHSSSTCNSTAGSRSCSRSCSGNDHRQQQAGCDRVLASCHCSQVDCQHSLVCTHTGQQQQQLPQPMTNDAGSDAECDATSEQQQQHQEPQQKPQLDDDVAVQKAAAQAEYAQQQHLSQAAPYGRADAAGIDASVLQQEQARLLQLDLPHRMFRLLLLCNMLCWLTVFAAKGPLASFTMSGGIARWPSMLLLAGGMGWLFMVKLRPLHFATTALEQQYAARYRAGRTLLDVWFNFAGCAGIMATFRAHATGAAQSDASAQHLAAAAAGAVAPAGTMRDSILPVVLMSCVLLSTISLMLLAPRTFRGWREQLLFVGKIAVVSGLIALNMPFPRGDSSSTLQAHQQHWLFGLGSERNAQATGFSLGMSAVQAFLLLTLMVRISAYLPMQLLHVTALLIRAVHCGSSGPRVAVYALQLLACGLWVPACLLAHLEVSARRLFLAQCQAQEGPTTGRKDKGLVKG